MVKKKTLRRWGWISLGAGLLVVIGSHIAILANPLMALGVPHAVVNLVAAGLIIAHQVLENMGRK